MKGNGEVDLSKLPRHKSGKNKGGIDWNGSIGYTVKFTYVTWGNRTKEGEIRILGWADKKRYLKIEYKGREKEITTSGIIRGSIGGIIDEYEFEIGETVRGCNKDVTIVEIGRAKNGEKSYKCRCNNCGYENWIAENGLIKQGTGCCGDGISIPEKFMAHFFNTVREEFKRQFSPNWDGLDGRKYDNHLPNRNAIVETHGKQHYEERNWRKSRGKSLVEERQNDKEKMEVALKNGINKEDYIVLDCRESTLEWIENSIRNSKLAEWYDLDKVNFKEIYTKTFSSIKVEAINLWKRGLNVNRISEELSVNVCENTIRRWLKDGSELGLCDYDGREEINKALKQKCSGLNNGKAKKIVMVDKDGNCDINKVNTRKTWAKELGISESTIKKLLNTNKGYDATKNRSGKNKQYLHGIKFYELDVYLQLQK